MPIYQEVLSRICVIERGNKEEESSQHDIESSDIDSRIGLGQASGTEIHRKNSKSKQSAMGKKPKSAVDLRHILGFLNQTEWIQNLNIGNIMQIAPLKQEELSQIRLNEECLSRESFLEVISFLIVGYFCASTEIRFIIQLKDEICKFKAFSIEKKT